MKIGARDKKHSLIAQAERTNRKQTKQNKKNVQSGPPPSTTFLGPGTWHLRAKSANVTKYRSIAKHKKIGRLKLSGWKGLQTQN